MAAFYPTLKHFLTERFDKNILNVVQKARTKKEFMVKLLFGEAAIPFTMNDPDIAYLYANGVVDNVDGYVQLPAPLYSKALITAFHPHSNGETQGYIFEPPSTRPLADDHPKRPSPRKKARKV